MVTKEIMKQFEGLVGEVISVDCREGFESHHKEERLLAVGANQIVLRGFSIKIEDPWRYVERTSHNGRVIYEVGRNY